MSATLKKKFDQVFDELSPKAKAEVVNFAEFQLNKEKKKAEQVKPKGEARVFGLHEGQGWMSDDFDGELPDEFWFGDDCSSAKQEENGLTS